MPTPPIHVDAEIMRVGTPFPANSELLISGGHETNSEQ
jgi:hypothetical protein